MWNVKWILKKSLMKPVNERCAIACAHRPHHAPEVYKVCTSLHTTNCSNHSLMRKGLFFASSDINGYITADNFIYQVRISWRENCELDPSVVFNPFLLDCPVEHPFVSLIHKCQMILLIKWESFGKKRLLTTVQYGFGLFVVLNWPSFSRLP